MPSWGFPPRTSTAPLKQLPSACKRIDRVGHGGVEQHSTKCFASSIWTDKECDWTSGVVQGEAKRQGVTGRDRIIDNASSRVQRCVRQTPQP